MKVIGLDPAKSCGICWTDGTNHHVTTWHLLGTTGQNVNQLSASLRDLINQRGCNLIAFEDASYGGKFQRTKAYHNALRGGIEALCAELDIEFWSYHPTQIKAATTGSGRADKEQMVRAVGTFYGIEVANHDEADAVGIAMMALKGIKPAGMVKREAKKAAKKLAKKQPRLF